VRAAARLRRPERAPSSLTGDDRSRAGAVHAQRTRSQQ